MVGVAGMAGMIGVSSATVDNVCPALSSIVIARQVRSDIDKPSTVQKVELFSTESAGNGAETKVLR